MFYRYIYFKAPAHASGLIQQAWCDISRYRAFDEVSAEPSDFKHELQRRIESTDGLVTWMDVLSNFTSLETLNRYTYKIDRLWRENLAASLPDLTRHVETFETCV